MVQQDSISLKTYVQHWSFWIFVVCLKLEPTRSLAVNDTWKFYWDQMGAKMVVLISPSFPCKTHTHTSHLFLSYMLQILCFPLFVFHLTNELCVCYWTHLVTLLSELGFARQKWWSMCIIRVSRSVWAFLNLSLGITVSLLWPWTVQYAYLTEEFFTTILLNFPIIPFHVPLSCRIAEKCH